MSHQFGGTSSGVTATAILKDLAGKLPRFFRRRGFIATVKRCAAKLEEIRFDRKFGIATFATTGDHADGYEPTALRDLKEIFSELRFGYENFIFIDVGSGKGRVLLLASEFPFKRIIGIESSPRMHSIAQKNLRAYRSTTQKCSAIESHHCDVTVYPFPVENTVLFLFNPFASPIVLRFLTNLTESLQNHPRDVYLIYHNPTYHNLIMETGFLEVVRMTELYTLYKNKMPIRSTQHSEQSTVDEWLQTSPSTTKIVWK